MGRARPLLRGRTARVHRRHTPRVIDWAALRNPIPSFAHVGVKDQALQWSGGAWHMLYSAMTEGGSPTAVHFSVAISSSAEPQRLDLATGHRPKRCVTRHRPRSRGTVHRHLPDTVRPRVPHEQRRLAALLVPPPTPSRTGWRAAMIDAPLRSPVTGSSWVSRPGPCRSISRSPGPPASAAGSVSYGRPDIVVYHDTVENYEFVSTGGVWRRVATSNTLDQPFLFTLGPGDPSVASTWLDWVDGPAAHRPEPTVRLGPRHLQRRLRARQLCLSLRRTTRRGLLTYAGSTELTRFGGWGHARIGIARSQNLINWQAAGQHRRHGDHPVAARG